MTWLTAVCSSLLVVAIASCGGGEDRDGDGSADPDSSAAAGAAAAYAARPGDRITALVALVEREGGEDTLFVDPRAVDAVFLTPAATEAYYAGSGQIVRPRLEDFLVRRWDPGWLPAPEPEGAGGCPVHCWADECFCQCYDILNLRAFGLMITRADAVRELWWINPNVVQAVFPRPEGASQFSGGVAATRNEGTPEGLLIPSGEPVPDLPGDVSFGRPM